LPREPPAHRFHRNSMNRDERERMYGLCALIEKERDHARFIQLIRELNDLFANKERRLEEEDEKR
jgi:hypothetical protein